MKFKLKHEGGITLIALIITIIILVILAAVSINAVTNMGIVGQAVNGSQEYTSKAKEENTAMKSTGNLIENTLGKLDSILAERKEIKFTIGSTEYTALEGMTWAEWCESDYSDSIAYFDGSRVWMGAIYNVNVAGNDKIVEGETYTVSSHGGGSN